MHLGNMGIIQSSGVIGYTASLIEFVMLAMTWVFWLLAGSAAFSAFAGPLLYSLIRRRAVGVLQNPGFDGNDRGLSVWCFQRGRWALLEDMSASGFVPGPPPAEPGLCEGYCMKVLSVPQARVR